MRKLSFTLLTAILLFSYACSDNPDDEIPVIPDVIEPEIEFEISDIILSPGSTGSETMHFTSNLPWTVELSTTRSVPDWFDVSPKSGGAGNATLTVTITKENELYDDRNAFIKIKAKEVVEVITVTQKKKEAIITSKDKVELGPDDRMFSIEIQSNVSYEVIIPEDSESWITQEEDPSPRGLSTKVEYFSVSAPLEEGMREGRILFKSGDIVETVQVFQVQKDVLVLTSVPNIVGNDGDEAYKIELRTNVEYEVIIPEEDQDWISVTVPPSNRALRTDNVYLKIAENKTEQPRSSLITIKDINSSLSQSVTITQTNEIFIIPAKKQYDISFDGEKNLEVQLTTNTEYSVLIPDDASEWISLTKIIEGEGNGNSDKLYFKIAANDTYSDRSAAITIADKHSDMHAVITINQSEIKTIITTDKVVLDAEATGFSIEVKSNIPYEVIIPEDSKPWISQATVPQGRALTTYVEHFTVTPATEDSYREGSVIFKSGNIEETVYIYQGQKDILILDGDATYTIPREGKEFLQVELRTNIDYSITIPEKDQSWVSIVPEDETRAVRIDKITFKIEANSNGGVRETVITFASPEQTQSLKLIQEGESESFILSPTEYDFDFNGGRIPILLRNGSVYDIIIPEPWITYSFVTPVNPRFIIAPNTTYEDRSQEIIIKDQTTGNTETITITQSKNILIEIEQNDYMVVVGGGTIQVIVRTNTSADNLNVLIDNTVKEWTSEPQVSTISEDLIEYSFRIEPNNTGILREAIITIEDIDVTVSETFKITQLSSNRTGIFTAEDLRTLVEELNDKKRVEVLSQYGTYDQLNTQWIFLLENDININPGTTFNSDGTFSGNLPKEWTPIKKFTEIFDGQGHIIKGIYINENNQNEVGGVCRVLEGGTIKNLELSSGVIIAKNCSYVGGIAGNAIERWLTGEWAVESWVESCINRLSIIVNGNTAVGGITGLNSHYGGIANLACVHIEGCINYGNIRHYRSGARPTLCTTGGISGSGRGNKINEPHIYGCINYGDIEVDATPTGGIIGTSHGVIVGCYNMGTITLTSRFGNGMFKATGGICGVLHLSLYRKYPHSDASYGSVIACYNAGKVIAIEPETASYTCGIVGIATHYETEIDPQNQVNWCYNMGAVSGPSIGTGDTHGRYENITNCYYLEGKGTGGIGIPVENESEMQSISAQLNAQIKRSISSSRIKYLFRDVPGGYPVLVKQ